MAPSIRARRFRLLLAGQTVSLLGSAVAPIAVAFAVLDDHSAADFGFVVAARMGPQLALMLVGGIVADRVRRNRVLLYANALAGGAQAATAAVLVFGGGRLWQLLALQAIGGAASAFLMPALTGIVAQVVEEADRQRANALLGLGQDLATIGGAAVGGILVAAIGPGWSVSLDAASYLVGALLLGAVRVTEPSRRRDAQVLRELADGWRSFRSRRWVWAVSAQFAVVNSVGMGAFVVLGPVVAKQALGGAVAWGLIQTAMTAGMVIGGIVALRRRLRMGYVGISTVYGLLLAVPLALLGRRESLALVVAVVFVFGIACALFETIWQTTLQNRVPEEALGRVTSWNTLMSFASIPLGVTTIGLVARSIGPSYTLWGAAAITCCASFVTLALAGNRAVRARSAPQPVATEA